MSGENYMESEFYNNSMYTQDISTKMRVPDKLMAHGADDTIQERKHSYMNGHHGEDEGHTKAYGMQVPDRILVAGSEGHLGSKSSGPRELLLEKSVFPPTPEHVRVQTPPRSIKLDEVPFPTASDEPTPSEQEQPPFRRNFSKGSFERGGSIEYTPDTSLKNDGGGEISLFEEVQMMRRQIAKLNHRLMAVELENQQQQQRETVLTVMVSGYFLVKVLLWLNRVM